MGRFKVTGREVKRGSEKNEAQINKLFSKISCCLMEVYVLFYLCIFPLCMHDKYFDILSFRFDLFWKPTLAYGFIYLVLGLLYLLCDTLYNEGAIRYRILSTIKINNDANLKDNNSGTAITKFLNGIKKFFESLKIRVTDIAITVLLVVFIISTVLSVYPYEAFWGDRGRYQGLLIWLMFYIAYWLVTRFYNFKKWHLWAFMGSASIVCIWGILNFFLVTFGMFDNTDNMYKYMFVSSIGNINTYTNFTGIFYGIAAAMFIRSKSYIVGIASFVTLVVSSFAQIMGLSDNVVLSTGIVLAVAPIILCENNLHITKYFIAFTTYLLAMKITSAITLLGIPTMNDPDPSTQITIAGKGFFIYVITFASLVTVFFAIITLKEHIRSQKLKHSNSDEEWISENKKNVPIFKKIWAGIIGCVFIFIVIILVIANSGMYEEIWESYKNILIFSDSWGTGRGLIWRLGMEYWNNDATLLMKLFGYGPDTFYIITMDRFMNIMQDAGYGMFDSAHNEYFEYFITVGIFGLTAYLAFIYVSLKNMLKSKDTYSIIIAMGILAYVFQAVVNIAIPITTPIFMILTFVGISLEFRY